MARTHHSSSRAIVVRAPSAPNIIRVSAPRAKHKKHHRRKGGAAGTLTTQRLIELALGGAAYGFIEKSFPNLPTVPIVGRAGTIAIALGYFGKGKGGLIRDIAVAAAVIAGHELGSTGKISGDEVVGGIAAQV